MERTVTVIIAGSLYVRPEDRDSWVTAHRGIIRQARSEPGCIDLYLSADPVEDDRINLFEHWESQEQLEAWRAIAEPPPKPEILRATVQKHVISSSGPPF
jgi:quinol monooxygenase YgiN